MPCAVFEYEMLCGWRMASPELLLPLNPPPPLSPVILHHSWMRLLHKLQCKASELRSRSSAPTFVSVYEPHAPFTLLDIITFAP